MEISDDELMRRVMRDDRTALGRLFDRHHSTVYAFLCRFTGDVLMAEDATQEAFWRVWQYRNSFAEGCPFRAWLFRIARNAALDEVRRRGRCDGDPVDVPPAGPRPAFPGSETDVSRRTLQDQVRAALGSLPEEQRLCLVLREYHELSHREIAEVLGCTEGHARVIGHRARQALRARLEPVLESEERCVG